VEVAERNNPWTVFLETSNPETPSIHLPSFNSKSQVLLFFKFYDPATEKLEYMGHKYVLMASKVSTLIPDLVKRAKLPPDTKVCKIYFINVKSPNLDLKQGISYLERESGRGGGPGMEIEIDGRNRKIDGRNREIDGRNRKIEGRDKETEKQRDRADNNNPKQSLVAQLVLYNSQNKHHCFHRRYFWQTKC
jgi:hypothetical protein